MAKKVQPVDILPAPSSSDEETEDENGSSSDTDDEQTPQHPQLFQKPINQESQNEESDESDDETEDDEPESKIVPFVKKPYLQESDDESDDDSDETLNSPSASAFAVKPIVSKPVSKSPEPKTPTSKPARVKSRAKRPADSEDIDKGIKAVSKNQEPGNVKGGNGKRPAEVEVEKVERSKKSKVSNGEGQSVGKVDKGSKSKKGASGDDESGEVEEKKSVVKWSEKDEADTDKGIKAVSKNQQPGNVNGGSGKRPAEVEKVERSKKSKVSNGEGQSVGKVEKGSKSNKGPIGDDESGEVEEKKSVVKWSEKDEAALLGGIIDYKAVTGEDVNSKVDSFYEYVKDLISVSLTKTQLHEKIRRLKKKFKTNVDKCQNGEEPVFSKPHESKLFGLSQKIWGGEGTVTEGNDSKGKSSKKKDKKDGNEVGNTSTPVEPVTSRELSVSEVIKDTIIEEKKEENQDFWSLYPWLCASLESEAAGYLSLRVVDLKEYVKGIISGLGEEKARELEDGWNAFHVMDHQLYAKRAHLISKQAQVVCDLLNQS